MENPVPASVEALEAQVLSLSPTDRSRLLNRLIASLGDDAETAAAWNAVAEAREADIDSGIVKLVAFEDAIARLEAKFPV